MNKATSMIVKDIYNTIKERRDKDKEILKTGRIADGILIGQHSRQALTDEVAIYNEILLFIKKSKLLEEVQELEDENKAYADSVDALDEALREEMTKTAAYEIMKKKRVCLLLLDGCDNVDQYNNSVDLFEIPRNDRKKYHLTQKDFTLLKNI